jgi:hypothetical protein
MVIMIACWIIIIVAFCTMYYGVFKKMTKGVVYSESLIGMAPAFIGMILGGIMSTVLYWIFRWSGLL